MAKDLGYNYAKESWLQAADLEPKMVSTFQWDWMHCYVADGIFVWEFREMMMRLKDHGLGGKEFNGYLRRWKWPKAHACGTNVCAGSATNKDHQPSGSASEMLAAAPVLERYLREVVRPTGAPA